MIGIIIYSLTFCVLIYLAYEDLKSQEISRDLTIFILLINVIYHIASIYFQNDVICNLNFCFDAYSSLLGGLVLGVIPLTIVLITKEKGMGIGDLFLFIIMGLLVGIDFCVLAMSITIFLAILYSVIKNKGIDMKKRIPLIPFIAVGTYVGFFTRVIATI